jgi:hypothetical protein
MGYQKIQAKRKEIYAKHQVMLAFSHAAKGVNEALAKIQKAQANLEQTKQKMAADVGKLSTGGVAEFEVYKKSLLGMAQSTGLVRPLPLAPVEMVVLKAQTELAKMVRAYEEKLIAAMPKEIKPGMTFKDQTTGNILEVTTPAQKSPNINLSGDAAIFFKVKIFKPDGTAAGEMSRSLSDLKKNKYLNTQ